jgi:hypothetical protein
MWVCRGHVDLDRTNQVREGMGARTSAFALLTSGFPQALVDGGGGGGSFVFRVSTSTGGAASGVVESASTSVGTGASTTSCAGVSVSDMVWWDNFAGSGRREGFGEGVFTQLAQSQRYHHTDLWRLLLVVVPTFNRLARVDNHVPA